MTEMIGQGSVYSRTASQYRFNSSCSLLPDVAGCPSLSSVQLVNCDEDIGKSDLIEKAGSLLNVDED
ncbi:unnamed protein product [Rotaria magnacalcarata]|uniref:Uncharacterized protein n=2 Tax=Rotaria magnacalcarata TaxID=392030 RepID=A0A820JZA2_9BILA|nr:unnamed protein product [Rotaria magnacalcarata]CAF4139877.1 unnamed protein product [Rotaria magnacalcarata]CAF4334025.1 unnamed protein product [Rotaria magnacalcarata]CAF4508286.1 unnamed protein product [Rotaria magnacalcarata]CAF5059763.1 unnamed protein product [Rotaria magnacalcarata]